MFTTTNNSRRSCRGFSSVCATVLAGSALLVLLCSFATVEAASLRVACEDPGRAIWINGTFFGTDEVFVDSLLTESVVIEVGEPLYSSAWIRPWQVTLAGIDGSAQKVDVPSLQRLTLRSPFQPIHVQLEGRSMGRTPLTLLVPRDAPVRLSAESEPGVVPSFSEQWSYHPQGARDSTLSLGASLPLTSNRMALEPQVWRSRSRYLLPLAAVVSGVVGVWARQTADRSYDNYLETTDLGRIESEYDRAARYDRIAIGCWAAAETFLVASVWTWLRGDAEESDSSQGRP